ncbi:MAG: T9SS type A sorting domain-containing protein [Bacteroidia bacterium]
MKNCIHFFLRLAMLAMMLVAGFYANAQRSWPNEETGNPEPLWCDEPCNVNTRRHIQVTFDNPTGQPMIINSYTFDGVTVDPLYSNANNSQPVLLSAEFIEFNERLPSGKPGPLVCSSPDPMPILLSAGGYYVIPAGSPNCFHFPLTVNPFTRVHIVAELSIQFCDNSQNSLTQGTYELQMSENLTVDQSAMTYYQNLGYIVNPIGGNMINVEGYNITAPLTITCDFENPTDLLEDGRLASLDDITSNITLSPNPASSRSNFTFELEQDISTSLSLYDNAGKLVKTFWKDRNFNQGKHEESLDLVGLSKGMYMVKYEAAGKTQFKKLVVM